MKRRVATVSGELDPLSTGIVYCELVCALQALAQYDLAEEWTEAMERWRHGQPVGSIHGRCRVHRAEILRLRGSCARGGAGSPAGLRGAASLPAPRVRVAADRTWPHPPAPGRHRRARRRRSARRTRSGGTRSPASPWCTWPGATSPLAAESIRDALEHPLSVPSKELPPHTELRRAPLFEAQVEIAVAAGDAGRGRRGSRRARAHRRGVRKQGARRQRGARIRTGRAGRRGHGGRPP